VINKTLNRGDGSVRVARRHDRMLSDFGRSPRGWARSDLTGGVAADEAVILEQAEHAGSPRAEDDDSGVSRHHNRKTRT
jgi:hypothetical protein